MTMRPPFDRLGPLRPARPVILSVPHAGRDYPSDLSEDCRVSADKLLPLEDRYVDLITGPCWTHGFSGLVARTPRAIIDLNRSEHDMDPAMLTAPMGPPALLSLKARGGLGLVPRRTAHLGELWRRRFHPSEIRARIEAMHRPYHAALGGLLQAARAQHGAALLLDIHSMPPLPESGGRPAADIVIGDRFGRSSASLYTQSAGNIAERAGYRVAFNAPYAGGHILDRHGVPARGLHAVQIELDRRLYLDESLTEPNEGLPRLAQLLADIALALSDLLVVDASNLAAE